MAVNIAASPERWSFSRNPWIFTVTGENASSATGVKAFAWWLPDLEFAALTDSPIEFFMGADLDFFTSIAWAASSSIADQEVAIPGEDTDPVEWLNEELIPVIMSIPEFSNHYQVYVLNDRLYMQALDYGPEFNIYIQVLGGSHEEVSGVLPVVEDPYSIRARINIENELYSGQYYRSPWFFFKLRDTGQSTRDIDLSEYVHELLRDTLDFEPPLYNISLYASELKTQRRVTVEFAEHFGEDPYTTISRLANDKFIHYGGYASRDESFSFLDQFAGQFLTNRPQVINTTADTIDYLHFYTNAEKVGIIKRVFYEDGTSEEVETQAFIDVLLSYRRERVYTISSGFLQCDLDQLQPDKVAYKYEIEVKELGGPLLIEKKVFVLDHDHYFRFSLLYLNSYGKFEGVKLQGQVTEEVETDGASYSIRKEGAMTSEDHRDDYLNNRMVESMQVSTGAVTMDQAQAVKDALIHSRAWFLPKAGAELFACTIEKGSFRMRQRGQDADHSYVVSMKLNFNEEVTHSNFTKRW